VEGASSMDKNRVLESKPKQPSKTDPPGCRGHLSLKERFLKSKSVGGMDVKTPVKPKHKERRGDSTK